MPINKVYDIRNAMLSIQFDKASVTGRYEGYGAECAKGGK